MLGLDHYRATQGWPETDSPAMGILVADVKHSFKNLVYDKIELRGLTALERDNITKAIISSETRYKVIRVECVGSQNRPAFSWGNERMDGLDIFLNSVEGGAFT